MTDWGIGLAFLAIVIAFLGTILLPLLNHRYEIKRQDRKEKIEMYRYSMGYYKELRILVSMMLDYIPEDIPVQRDFLDAGFSIKSETLKKLYNEWFNDLFERFKIAPDYLFLTNKKIKDIFFSFQTKYPTSFHKISIKNAQDMLIDLNKLIVQVEQLIQKELKIT